MFWTKTLPLASLVGASLVLVSAMAQPPARGPQPTPPAKAAPKAPPAPPAKADPAAQQAFDEAIRALDRQHLTWIETTLWQQMEVPGLTIRTEGQYLAGPDHRLNLDLKVSLGDTAGRLQVICDGATLWEVEQLGTHERRVIRKVEMKKVLEALNNPNTPPQVRDEFFQSQSFTGVIPLLQSLRQRMVFTRKESARWKEHDTIQLTAVWSPESAKPVQQDPQQGWPAYLPRQCKVFLDAGQGPLRFWPHRLEWWGPTTPQGQDVLLFQLEFRDPKLNQAMTPERFAQVFSFTPALGAVSEKADKTGETIEVLTMRSKQVKGAK